MAETAYIVLRQSDQQIGDEDRAWRIENRNVQAASAEAAIRRACQASEAPAHGTYVAIPARSWRPVSVQAVQTTTIKFGEAS